MKRFSALILFSALLSGCAGLNIPFIGKKDIRTGGVYKENLDPERVVDLVIIRKLTGKKKLAIFVHGCYWHRCPDCKPSLPKTHKKFWREKFKRNIRRDKQKQKALHKIGWSVITIWECQLKQNSSLVEF